MKIFSFLKRDTSAFGGPEWTYAAHGNIWRILFSQSGRVVGESRDHQQKRATFFCLDEQRGLVLWQDIQHSELWWVGIEAVHQDVVLLHEFANPGLPEHKGIVALGLEEGKELWRNNELTFWFAYQEAVYAYKTLFEKRVGYKLHLNTGEVVEEYSDALGDLFALRALTQSEQQSDDFVFPEILEQSSLDSVTASIVQKETKGAAVQGEIEFIRQHPYLLLNYYLPGRTSTVESPMLENRFCVYDLERESRVFSDVLTTDAKAPTPDSFFVKGSLVYYIKNQSVLTALRLESKLS